MRNQMYHGTICESSTNARSSHHDRDSENLVPGSPEEPAEKAADARVLLKLWVNLCSGFAECVTLCQIVLMLKQRKGTAPASGWILLALAATVVVVLTGCTNGSSGRQNEEQLAELELLADDVASKGHLRPVFPAYVPRDLPKVPFIIDSSDQHVVFEFRVPDGTEPTANPWLVSLQIAEWHRDARRDHCEILQTFEDCVTVFGSDASVGVTRSKEGRVVNLDFYLAGRDFQIRTAWQLGSPDSEDTISELTAESVRIAESLTQE